MRSTRRKSFQSRLYLLFLLKICCLLFIIISSTEGRTIIFPHLLEQSGGILNNTNTFDTQIFITYTAGQATVPTDSGGASVNIYIFDDSTEAPLKSQTNQDVCNPCTFTFGQGQPRKRSLTVEGLANLVGGLAVGNYTGFIIAETSGDDENLVLSTSIKNIKADLRDVSHFFIQPQEVNLNAPRFFATAEWREQAVPQGHPFSFSQSYHFLYTGGLPPATPLGSQQATVTVHLFSSDGQLFLSNTNQPVCNPCIFPLNNTNRKISVNFKDLINIAGGFPTMDVTGFATFQVSGDAPNTFIQGQAVNVHQTTSDVSFFNLDPQFPKPTGGIKTFVFPYLLEQMGTIETNPNTFDSTIFIVYAGGLPGAPLFDSLGATGKVQIDIYLFDALGNPQTDACDANVAFPATFTFGPDDGANVKPKRGIRLDNLFNGGIPGNSQFVSPNGLVVCTPIDGGDCDLVNIDLVINNSHTGPFDVAPVVIKPLVLELEPALSSITNKKQNTGQNEQISLFKNLDSIGTTSNNLRHSFPHFEDSRGRIETTAFATDTLISAVYDLDPGAGSLGGNNVILDFYIFDDATEAPLRSDTNQEVCNPCSYTLDVNTPTLRLIVDDLINAAGGYSSSAPNVKGYIEAIARGDIANLKITGLQFQSRNDLAEISPKLAPDPANLQIANLVPKVQPFALAPTVATAEISGRVLTSSGRGISRASVQITDQKGHIRTATTNQFGYYHFEGIEVGQSLIVNVFSKQYQFTTQVVTLDDSISNLNFIAQELKQ